jgi:hypothetical protein
LMKGSTLEMTGSSSIVKACRRWGDVGLVLLKDVLPFEFKRVLLSFDIPNNAFRRTFSYRTRRGFFNCVSAGFWSRS